MFLPQDKISRKRKRNLFCVSFCVSTLELFPGASIGGEIFYIIGLIFGAASKDLGSYTYFISKYECIH